MALPRQSAPVDTCILRWLQSVSPSLTQNSTMGTGRATGAYYFIEDNIEEDLHFIDLALYYGHGWGYYYLFGCVQHWLNATEEMRSTDAIQKNWYCLKRKIIIIIIIQKNRYGLQRKIIIIKLHLFGKNKWSSCGGEEWFTGLLCLDLDSHPEMLKILQRNATTKT